MSPRTDSGERSPWRGVREQAQRLSGPDFTIGPRTLYKAIQKGELEAAPVSERGDVLIRARPCPLVMAGKRCRLANCLCDAHRGLLDNAVLWLDDRRRYVLTSEPYGAEGAGGLQSAQRV